jgi:hypothetical protein
MRRLVADGAEGERRIAVTVNRQFAPSAVPAGALVRLNMPKPLNARPGSHTVRWLRLDGVVGDPIDEGGRYVVKARRSDDGPMEIAIRHEFIPGTYMGEPGGELTLRPSEGLVRVTPRVRALAEKLGLSARDPRQSLRRIWDFLFDEMSFGFLQYERLAKDDPLCWSLDHGRVDCRVGSALIVALCRAVDIPARMVVGYTLHPALPTSHVWAEAWFGEEGWRPFDTYAVDLAGDDRASLWRDHFFGRIDRRFVAEVLPREFCGLGSPRLPTRWQLSMALTEAGAATWFHDASDGAVIYRETISVQDLCSEDEGVAVSARDGYRTGAEIESR